MKNDPTKNKNIVQQLGPLALGSRLKQVSELLFEHVGKVYSSLDIALPTRFFPLFYTLTTESDIGITALANRLRTTHPAVSQMVSELIKQGLVVTETPKKDVRRTHVKLSPKGITLAERLQPIWDDIERSLREILDEAQGDLMGSLNRIEHLVEEKNLAEMVLARQKQKDGGHAGVTGVTLEEWMPGSYEHLYFFERLTVEWFGEYGFNVEAVDTKTFEDPEAMIIKPGGRIIFARYQGSIVGVIALMRKRAHVVELARMAVTKSCRGRGIGELLASRGIEEAKQSGAKEVFLETNTAFKEATKLYKKLGFVQNKKAEIHYKRANQVFHLAI